MQFSWAENRFFKPKSPKLNTDETFYCWVRKYWCTKSTTRPHTWRVLPVKCQHHAEITQSHTSTAMIPLFTTTHNLPTFNTSEISSSNSKKLILLADKNLLTFPSHLSYSSSRMYGRTVARRANTVFSHHKKSLGPGQVQLQFCSHLTRFTTKSLFPRPKTSLSP